MAAFDLLLDSGIRRAFDVPDGARIVRAELGGLETGSIRIIAKEIAQTESRWDDLCISEVRVFEQE